MFPNKIILPAVLIKLLKSQRYGVEFQPIINVANQEVFAYEALARFFDEYNQSMSPDSVYAALHHSPLSLFQVEFEQKQLQLYNTPKNFPTFVNLDQDSYFSGGIAGDDNPFLRLFTDYKASELVIELIENSEVNDAIMSLSMIDHLSKAGIKTAIDDVFHPQSMISTSVIQLVNFIKLDKHVVANKNKTELLILVRSIIDYAHQAGKQVILEGVETYDDFLFAQQLKVDFVQGFLYKEQFINIS
jgi:EAL domain-containing protein (putative c-di-GMP-specific phosphodiesterase class I)